MTATISFRREDLERTIELLVTLLDHAEPDPDLEPSGDEEPSLGWPIPDPRWGDRTMDMTGGDDREGDTANREPSLGWQNEGSQSCLFGQVDDGDNEPSLGWTDMEGRYGRYGDDSTRDLEEQCEDEGAQCDDEGVPNDELEPDYRDVGIPPAGYIGFNP